MLEGRGGALLNNVLYGEAPLRSNPLTLLYMIFDRKGSPSCIPSTGKMVPRSHTYNQGQSTWVTLLWYLSFSLPMQFCNGFFRGIVQVRGQHWKRQGKGGWAQHFKIFLQLTQVLMSQIVVKNFATLCCIRKIHSLHKTYTRNLKKLPFRCRVVKSSWLLPKIATYMYSVSNGRLLCLAFLYRWCFLNNKSLDWPLTLTTQPSTSKLSDITLYRPSQWIPPNP